MAITAITTIDQIIIQDNGLMTLRQVRRAYDDDGSIIGDRVQRVLLEPGDNVSSQPNRVQRICQAVWTQAVIDAYLAAKAAHGVQP